ncbi:MULTISPECIES: NAD(P)H-dependent oxidoreductase [unclassified Halomonas]|uniref:NADPH-dependent FMN reductase n=1 Tax=unclassified Halomonas TaxID=2609666 RepID=UPI000C935FF9|nr:MULTISPECIES: NAD(P)H-dependent oxidoreductase [unclassified Halomonas]MAR71122.1 FMN reductase [Halomonas sp.]
MSDTRPRILVFAGSAREDSFNKRLARLMAQRIDALGGQATFVDLRDFPMPIYDGDLEAAEGLPEHASRLKRMFMEHQGLAIASPEYNGFITPLLKNTIDWVSRPDGDLGALEPYQHKVAAIVGASPGGLGGLRALPLLRQLLSNIGVTVLPDQLAVGGAGSAFHEDGSLADEGKAKALDNICQRLVTTLARSSQ